MLPVGKPQDQRRVRGESIENEASGGLRRAVSCGVRRDVHLIVIYVGGRDKRALRRGDGEADSPGRGFLG